MKPKSNRVTGDGTYDRCLTPSYAVEPLLPYLPAHCHIWESACGVGTLAHAISSSERAVDQTDLDYGLQYDYFSYHPEKWDIQITNPPFSIKFAWLARAYALGKPFALLMPVEMIGAAKAQTLFKDRGIEIIYMDKRVDFFMPEVGWEGSGAQFPVAWYTHGLAIGRQITFAKLNKPTRDELYAQYADWPFIKNFDRAKAKAIIEARRERLAANRAEHKRLLDDQGDDPL